ncbi:MAG: HNH endonuclease [Armatimonadia bacterium]
MEEWRFFRETFYQVSSHGRVKGQRGQILKLRPGSNGYLRVQLCDGIGPPRDFYVHRMVAECFISLTPNPDWHADHIDRDITNNAVENLRWMAPEDNRALRQIAKGEASGVSKLTEDQVRDILSRPRGRGMAGKIAAEYGVSREQVRDIINRKYWRHI